MYKASEFFVRTALNTKGIKSFIPEICHYLDQSGCSKTFPACVDRQFFVRLSHSEQFSEHLSLDHPSKMYKASVNDRNFSSSAYSRHSNNTTANVITPILNN